MTPRLFQTAILTPPNGQPETGIITTLNAESYMMIVTTIDGSEYVFNIDGAPFGHEHRLELSDAPTPFTSTARPMYPTVMFVKRDHGIDTHDIHFNQNVVDEVTMTKEPTNILSNSTLIGRLWFNPEQQLYWVQFWTTRSFNGKAETFTHREDAFRYAVEDGREVCNRYYLKNMAA